MALFIKTFIPDQNLKATQSKWSQIGSLSITVSDPGSPVNLAATVSIGKIIFGEQISNTYYFRIVCNEVPLIEASFSDWPTIKKNISPPITLMGVDSMTDRKPLPKTIAVEWKYEGSANGYIPAKTICSLSVIADAGA